MTRINKKSKSFLFEQLAAGHELAAVCAAYPDRVPSLEAVLRKRQEDARFAAALDAALSMQYVIKHAELSRLSRALSSEEYPGVERPEAEATLKRRIDVLKFDLLKLAPIWSSAYNAKKSETKKSTKSSPNFTIDGF
jgi:hypothetical protein